VLDTGSVLPAANPSQTAQGAEDNTDASLNNTDTVASEGAPPAQQAEQERPKPKCQFPGCEVDIGNLKNYNKRCKICDEHRLAESVLLDGVENRFCQQCNRFHTIDKFDVGKKGCKDKLEKHNKRRRFNRQNKAGMAEGMAVNGLSLGANNVPPLPSGGFMEDMARAAKQMRLPEEAAKNVFSQMATAAAAASVTPEAGKEAAGAATDGAAAPGPLQLPPGFPNNMQLPPGMQLPGGLPPPTNLPTDVAALQADPNNRQSFQNYVLLAAYAAYMSGFQQ